MNRPLRLALSLLLCASTASAAHAGPSPLGVLRGAGLIKNVQFQGERANYNVWRFQGSGQANMQGLFMKGAGRGNSLKTFQLSLLSPNQKFRSQQLGTLQKAVEELSRECFGTDLKNLDTFIDKAAHSKTWPSVTRGRTTEITVMPSGPGARLTVEVSLPGGQSPQCRVPRP